MVTFAICGSLPAMPLLEENHLERHRACACIEHWGHASTTARDDGSHASRQITQVAGASPSSFPIAASPSSPNVRLGMAAKIYSRSLVLDAADPR